MPAALINLAYLAASILFIVGLRGLGHPRTAVRGNLLAAGGMLLAVLVTLLDRRLVGYGVIAAGLAVGGLGGAVLAQRIRIAAMPQLVALLNGLGGGASVLVAGSARIEGRFLSGVPAADAVIAALASGIIGSVTFAGSLVAFGKLQGLVTERSITFRGQRLLSTALTAVVLGLAAWGVGDPAAPAIYRAAVAAGTVLGILLVLPVGGADMPVIIALLNSFSGLAAAATGFVLSNNGLIIAGALVGASGAILTHIMCAAMNRSLPAVLFGAPPAAGEGPAEAGVYAGRIKSTDAEEVAMLLDGARRVVIIPGYGMAVAQAQHAVRDLARLLEGRGVTVEFAIHPVAGRMPGHMNVLLAEASVPYEQLKELDDINPTFDHVDVALVIGANDVVNPLARTDPTCAIAGMPILDVDRARAVVVIKRSLSPGFAGIANPLFAADNTLMLFADGKQAIVDLIGALKTA